MNRHLNNAELVECLENDRTLPRRAHLERCEKCRSRMADLRATLEQVQRAQTGDIPEPSPLFWQHFSRRVHDAIENESPVVRPRWLTILAPAAAVIVLCAGALAVWSQQRSLNEAVPATDAAVAPAVTPLLTEAPMDLDEDVEWALVRVAADDLEWDSAADAGIRANPGAAERVALEMSAAERTELERLIEAELKETGA